MPEYLAPGVYVEEVSFRSKSIEGVPTSTTGFAGMTRYGPVQMLPNGPATSEPRLVTSFTEFERVYGGLEPLVLEGGIQRVPYLPHAARAFFMNGGKRLYVSRVFFEGAGTDGVASLTHMLNGIPATWTARWPGAFGNVFVALTPQMSGNVAVTTRRQPPGQPRAHGERGRHQRHPVRRWRWRCDGTQSFVDAVGAFYAPVAA